MATLGEAKIAVAPPPTGRRAATAISLPLLVAALALAGGSSVLQIGALLGASAALVVGAVVSAWLGSGERSARPEARQGTVEIDDDALTLVVDGNPTRIARTEIACARVELARASVRSADGAEMEITMESPAAARALANAAGAHPGSRAITFPVGRRATAIRRVVARSLPARATVGATVLAFLGIYVSWALALGSGRAFWEVAHLAGSGVGTAIGGTLAAVGALAGSLAWLSLFRRREITVGSDGVVVRGLLGRRFIPFASIASVGDVEAGADAGVELTLTGGETLFLPGTAGNADLGPCIREAMAARGAADAATKLRLLDRGERSVEAWRRDLAKLARKGEGYRDESFASESLASVVEDAAVAPDRRVGAALLLAAAGDEPAKARVRIAASACVDDDLRVALEQAAEGEVADEALEKAARRAV